MNEAQLRDYVAELEDRAARVEKMLNHMCEYESTRVTDKIVYRVMVRILRGLW